MQRYLPSPLPAGGQRRFVLFGAIYVVLWLSTWYSAGLLDRLGVVSLWFLPAGLRFCNLLVFGWRGFLLEVTVQLGFALLQLTQLAGAPLPEIVSMPMFWRLFDLFASLLANAAVIFPLRWSMRERWDLARPGHSVLFLAAALAASALAAAAHTFHLLRLGSITQPQAPEVLANWLTGDFIGTITLAAFLMVRVVPGLVHYLHHGSWNAPGKPAAANAANAAQDSADLYTTLTALLALLLVFGIPWSLDLNQHFPLIALLLLLPLAGVALYRGLRAAVLAVLLLDGGLVILISLFGQQEYAFQFQFVMVTIALVGLWLGGAVDARKRLLVRYRDFASVSNDLLWETDTQGRLREASGRLATRISPAAGQSWRSLLGDESSAQLAELDEALARKQPFRNVEVRLQGDGKTPLWVKVNGVPLLDEAGELVGYRGTAVDISLSRWAEKTLRNYNDDLRREVAERTKDLRQTNSELATKERHLQVLLAAAPVGVLEFDAAHVCCFINVNGCVLTGCTQHEALGHRVLDFVHPDERDHVDFVWQINRHSDQVHWLEFRLKRSGLRCAAHWINLSHSAEQREGTIMVLTNVTARSQQDERLWTLAHHDALTDLPNRNLFWDRMEQAVRHARRRDGGVAVLWIDLDGFKAVNDSLGHAAGDALLQQVARRLKSRTRDSDTVARMGGDEFAVILPEIRDPDGALHIAATLVASLAEAFDLVQGQASISGSIGVALYPQHADSVATLTQCADLAMYAAKNSGKNRVKLWQAA
jgi:diguanylate cyclase (GGDEF)-like protein/PAS domain S-box-containing protein